MEMYHFVTHWFFNAPIERVWAAMSDVTRWPEWWPAWKQVSIRGNGSEAKPGSILDLKLRAPAGYSFAFTVQVTTWEPPRCFEIASQGDLVGTGKMVLEALEGGTAVDFFWDVGTSNGAFNLVAKLPFMKRVFEWNHGAVMAAGERGLREKVLRTP